MTQPAPLAQDPLRILVADPDDRIRESLSRILRIGGRCVVVGTAGLPAEALELARTMAPDVIMVDTRLAAEASDGGLVDRLRAAAPGTRIIVLSWTDAAGPAPAVARADAYIRKTFRPHELIDAVVNAARTPAA